MNEHFVDFIMEAKENSSLKSLSSDGFQVEVRHNGELIEIIISDEELDIHTSIIRNESDITRDSLLGIIQHMFNQLNRHELEIRRNDCIQALDRINESMLHVEVFSDFIDYYRNGNSIRESLRCACDNWDC